MAAFLMLVGFTLTGTLYVFFLLQREDKKNSIPSRDLDSLTSFPPPLIPQSSEAKKKAARLLSSKSIFSLPFFHKKVSQERELREEISGPIFMENSDNRAHQKPIAGTSVPQTQLSLEQEKRIEQEIDLAAKIEELKEKYARLDKLFNEKSAALEKSEELLKAELSNRKEFNKLKDIFEKELKESKDRTRVLQVDLTSSKTETENYQSRIKQSEEKISKLEKSLLVKDDEIFSLVKRLDSKPELESESKTIVGQPLNTDDQKGESNG